MSEQHGAKRPTDFGGIEPQAVLGWVRERRDEMVALIRDLSVIESPTDVPTAQREPQRILTEAFGAIDYSVHYSPGHATGGLLLARPRRREKGLPLQMLVGHCDTVWPLGTLVDMPVEERDGCLYGPGTFDMKAGLVLILFALRAIRELGGTPPATPVVLVNSDEEIGSPDSGRVVRKLARRVCRAFVAEPSMGAEGKIKTARKGVGNFDVVITGKATHAGLNPGGGASAISELSHAIQALHALNNVERGTTVNVGVVSGGTRPNVVAAHARAEVDVRVATADDGARVEREVLALAPVTDGVTVEVTGGMRIPPLERTPRNRRLWQAAQVAGAALGLDLQETMVGGASDGSVVSQFAATLDGLGAVGDGAHALHEHIAIEATVDRCALLALLLLSPVDAGWAE